MRKLGMNQWGAILIGVVLSGMVAQNVSAAQVYYLRESGNWGDSASTDWSNATTKVTAFPLAADYAIVASKTYANPVLTLNSDVGTVNRVWVGSGGFGAGTFNVVTGGSLYTAGSSEVGYRTNGTMNISGGYFRSGSVSGSQAIFVGADLTSYVHSGTLVISGGTVESKFKVGAPSGDLSPSADTMRIIGNAATIGSSASQGTVSGLSLGNSAVLEFIFNSTGISKLNFTASDAVFNSGSKIIVDGALYAGTAQTLTLIDATTFTGTPTIELKNFGAGTTSGWDTANGLFTVYAVAVPEPATLGMVGLGALALMMYRRNRRA